MIVRWKKCSTLLDRFARSVFRPWLLLAFRSTTLGFMKISELRSARYHLKHQHDVYNEVVAICLLIFKKHLPIHMFSYTHIYIYIYIYEFYIVELSIYHATPPFLLTKRTEFLLPGVPATHQTVKAAMRFPGWPVTSNEDGFSESSVVSLNKIRRFFFEIKRNPPKKRSIAKKHLKMVLGFGSFGGLSIL